MKKLLTIEHAVHLVMVCFAISSLWNVGSFLVDAGHPLLSAALLSTALAVGLTALSIMLTGVDKDGDAATFWTITAAATALGVLSGALQSAEYHKHLNMAWSLFLGFLSPLAGEVGLAWASSLYSKANKRRRFASIGAELEASVADVMVEAMDNVDRGAVQRRVDRVLNQMASLAIDSAAQKAMAMYVKQPHIVQNVAIETAPNVQNPTPILNEISPILHETELDPIAKMNAAKQAKIAKRRDTILNHLNETELSIPDLATLLGVSANTVRNDLEALQSAGHAMSVNGVVKLA